jgi:hypothetical protein
VSLSGSAVKTAIVVTTIYEPRFLEGYLTNLDRFGQRRDTAIYVIPDRKTPRSVYDAADTAARTGFRVQCPDAAAQEAFLASLGVPSDFIPWNTDNRRNVGFLSALVDGCDVLISIDDDNYCPKDVDFVGGHRTALGHSPERSADLTAHGSGWFNPCALLSYERTGAVFPRGFPYQSRTADAPTWRLEPIDAHPPRVTINAGLWLGDPDVDAITRLAVAPRAVGFTPPSVVLDHDLWMPVDSQNTALSRDAVAAYYYVRMRYPVSGLVLDRFGDIFSGYFVQKCARHLGHALRVGTPVADHRRSPHDLIQDLYHELAGIALLEDFAPWLREERIEGSTYSAAYASLAEHIEQAADRFDGSFWRSGGRDFLRATASNMRTWLGALERMP